MFNLWSLKTNIMALPFIKCHRLKNLLQLYILIAFNDVVFIWIIELAHWLKFTSLKTGAIQPFKKGDSQPRIKKGFTTQNKKGGFQPYIPVHAFSVLKKGVPTIAPWIRHWKIHIPLIITFWNQNAFTL